ncbi:MAG: NAD(P)/FAD-dependent oxidoreductase, partial [Candidatus Hydrogenedentes bacterium]|nr:NAD(P)/FAD-dependent oxidoreductase [Candidatus Hydrogenedentota bacterium]
MDTQTEPCGAWALEGRQPRIAVIGAGMSGICAVIKLRKAGYTDLTVYEKADKVGGTWRENTYPGLSCDVPSHWYSFSFELNPNWSHRFSYGPEIQAYMEHVAEKYDVTRVVQFNKRVTELTYEGPTWRLKTDAGDEEIYDLVFSATGVLHQPAYPDIPGLDSFAGAKFHTTRWDHSVELEGKRVGIIGTGSTASQIIGTIAENVGHLFVFQRTPQWMAELPQKKYSELSKKLLKLFPFAQRLLSFYYYKLTERTFAEATIGNKYMQQKLSEACLKNLEENVPDPELRAKLTPDYQAACKRLIICSDFYPAMCRENVDLVTERIQGIEAGGVRTEDGTLHELDVLVIATGFDVCKFILPTRVIGEYWFHREEFWDGAPRAH